MDKISYEQVAELLQDAAATLRIKEAENLQLREENASLHLRERTDKLAAQMHGKGISVDRTVEELSTYLGKLAHEGKQLDVIEQGVEMVGPDMGQKIAQLSDAPSDFSGASDLERFLAGGLG